MVRRRQASPNHESIVVCRQSRSYTVRDCIEEYIDFLTSNRRSAEDARWRADSTIVPALGDVPCSELTQELIEGWRNASADAPLRLRTKAGAPQRYRHLDEADEEQLRKRRATTNRTLIVLKAALNKAWREGKLSNDDSWRSVDPFEGVDVEQPRYLTIDQCERLLNASEGSFRDLVSAALVTGGQFSELASLRVGDFDAASRTLRLGVLKSSRQIVLNDEGLELFQRLTSARADIELILSKPDGNPWGKMNQSMQMRQTCERAKIEPTANFHCLRHSYAAHAIMAGVPLVAVAQNLGHADTRMVERHYGHLHNRTEEERPEEIPGVRHQHL